MQLKRLLVGSAVSLALISCGGSDSTEPTVNASGSLTFSFTGAGATSGSYNATGAVPVTSSSSLGTTAWAAGTKSTSTSMVTLAAAIPKSGSTWDIAAVEINRVTTGTGTISSNCTTSSCTDVTIVFGSSQSGNTFTFVCSLTSGSVTLASISTTKATGSFSGSGTCFTSAGASSNFTITNGSFDVPITGS